MQRALGQRIEAFEERDSFLRALLGLGLVCSRFDRVLTEFGRAGPAIATDVPAEPDDVLLLVLGAVALRQRLGEVLEGLSLAPDAPEGPRPASASGPFEGLLR